MFAEVDKATKWPIYQAGFARPLINFILAHELEHFVQDLSVLKNGNGKTVNVYTADEDKNDVF